MQTPTSIQDRDVAAVFAAYPKEVRPGLLALRELILETADSISEVGPLDEVLKWGQPGYITGRSRSGSTVRVAPAGAKSTHDYGMYFICSTTLVNDFKELFGDTFAYEGTRALLFKVGDDIPVDELRECITMALTYHSAKA